MGAEAPPALRPQPCSHTGDPRDGRAQPPGGAAEPQKREGKKAAAAPPHGHHGACAPSPANAPGGFPSSFLFTSHGLTELINAHFSEDFGTKKKETIRTPRKGSSDTRVVCEQRGPRHRCAAFKTLDKKPKLWPQCSCLRHGNDTPYLTVSGGLSKSVRGRRAERCLGHGESQGVLGAVDSVSTQPWTCERQWLRKDDLTTRTGQVNVNTSILFC